MDIELKNLIKNHIEKTKKVQAIDFYMDYDIIREIIFSGKFKEVDFLYYYERGVDVPPYIISEYVKRHDIKCRALSSGVDCEWLKFTLTRSGFEPDTIETEIWPTYHFTNFYREYVFKQKKSLTIVNPEELIHPFLCLNNNPRYHRSLLIDILAQHNLIDKGIVSYGGKHNLNYIMDDFKWQYHSGYPLRIKENVIYSSTNYDFAYNISEHYNKSFLNVVTESSTDSVFITEKTVKPLLLGLPFIVIGSVGYHKSLKKMGFEYYDEILDYSFDEEIDLKKRIEKSLVNIDFVIKNKHKLYDLYSVLKPKIEKNKHLAIEYATSSKHWPNMIKEHFLQLKEPNNQLICAIDYDFVQFVNEHCVDYKFPNKEWKQYGFGDLYEAIYECEYVKN